MKFSWCAVLALASVCTPSRADESNAAETGKAALAKLNALIDRPADAGLRSMTGIVHAKTPGESVTIAAAFAAPATFSTQAAGPTDEGVRTILEMSMNGVSPLDGETADAEIARADGKDLLVLTVHRADGAAVREEFTLDADGLPAAGVLRERRMAKGAEREQRTTLSFTWTKAGEKHRLTAFESTVEGKSTVSTTLAYEEFDGIAIATSWKTELVAYEQTIEYAFTELALNGRKVELKATRDAPPVASAEVEAKIMAILETYRGLRSEVFPDPLRERLVAIGRPAVGVLLKVICDGAYTGEPIMQLAAARALPYLVIKQDVPFLVKGMHEGHRELQLAFERLDDPESVAAFAALIREGCFMDGLWSATWRHLRQPAIVEACCAWLADPKYDGDMNYAIEEMANLVGGSYPTLLDDPSPELAKALSARGPWDNSIPEAAPALEALLKRHLQVGTWRSVASALVRVGDKAGIPELIEILDPSAAPADGRPRHELGKVLTTDPDAAPSLDRQRHEAGKLLNWVSGTQLYVGRVLRTGPHGPVRWEGNFAEAAKGFDAWWRKSKDTLRFDSTRLKWSDQ